MRLRGPWMMWLLVSVVAAACGAEGVSLFGTPDEIGSTGGGSGSGTGGATLASSAESTSTTSVSSSGSASSSAESVAASSGATGSSSSASSSSTVASSSSSGGGPSVQCGESICDVSGGESCCWDKHGLSGSPAAECTTGDVMSDDCETMQDGWGPETRIECDGPEDCPNEICCARRKNYFANGKQYTIYDQLTCESSCQDPNRMLCEPDVTVCPMLPTMGGFGSVQAICKQSSLLPIGYLVCAHP